MRRESDRRAYQGVALGWRDIDVGHRDANLGRFRQRARRYVDRGVVAFDGSAVISNLRRVRREPRVVRFAVGARQSKTQSTNKSQVESNPHRKTLPRPARRVSGMIGLA